MVKLRSIKGGVLAITTLATLGLQSCVTQQNMGKKLAKEFKKSAIMDKYHVGFALYDKQKEQMVYQKDAHKYFVPASNTKLFTFYAGLKLAPDSIPSLRYVETADSLIFWGTGDPSLLHSDLKGVKAIEKLKNTTKKLYFSPERYKGDFYGRDWAWDDFNEYYQPEISELPLFDNVALVKGNSKAEMNVSPPLLAACFVLDTLVKASDFYVQRNFLNNDFRYTKAPIKAGYKQYVPFKTSTSLTLSLLADTLKKEVKIVNKTLPPNAKTIFSSKSDDVFRQLMLPSDNFVAEQLLLTYADRMGIALDTRQVIKTIEERYLADLPDKPKWIDGSGLSKGNLFTPRSIIKLLDLIYTEVNDQKRLFSMMPAGGQTGTLRNAFPKTNTPFVFGKTGTLGGVHNQSGYILTKKGKLLYYSFMNNNFVQTTADVRKEMVNIVTYIHENF